MSTDLRQEVTVTKITPEDRDNIKAHANVIVSEWIKIGRMRVLVSKEGGYWVAWPKERVDEGYEPTINFDLWPAMKRAVEDAVLEEFNKVVLPMLKSEEPSQQRLEFLRKGSPARGSMACSNQRQKRWTRKEPTKKAQSNPKHANRQVFGDCLLPDEDISDVGA